VPRTTSSRVFNRQSVQDAIRSILAKLKYYKAPPTNGLAIFCGNYTTEAGKSKWINATLEPLKPTTHNLYYCGSKFHTETLKAQLEDSARFGIILVDGSGCSMHVICGDNRETLVKWDVSLPKKHGRGGQSHDRFRRIREEKRDWYVKDVIEAAVKNFIDPATNKPNVEGLIVAGFGDLKREFVKSQYLDKRIQSKVIKVLDIQYNGDTGLNETIQLASDVLKGVKLVREKELLSKFMETIATDGAYCIGARDTLTALESGIIETLIVWDNLPTIRRKLKSKSNGETRVLCINHDTTNNTNVVEDADNTDWEVEEEGALLDWLMDNYHNFGAKIELVSDNSPLGDQFTKGLGGLGGLLRYKLDMTAMDEQETNAMPDEDDGDDYDLSF
jgi:peptide chain release factor subunit 1